jgi:uncharacterized lipoprotein
MTITRIIVGLVAVTALAGCSAPERSPANVKAAAEKLGNPPTNYEQPAIYKPLGATESDVQTLYLFPMNGGVRIVDERGVIYENYDEFLLNNTLTD